ncbi:peptidyl-prolyl cis-trans isomerase D [Comamonas sp. BIGb0124]|uniref:SurA N-terminal domain-containing protein n=1 Tax=Comamonas sp. BIGb0124 TaxID=2485130 RepID=UPI000F4834AC|nr:SurA N-terminal domain-containing protein [Comamonas sp. BIGb0124]ROR18007.1 peptidyl-prolyl cis-trans isomerase D [Comamonas sp. BIGb0124]
MFDFVRKNTKFLMIVLFLLIVPSFVLLGVEGYTRNQERSETVAVVDGQKITAAEWDNAHRAQVDRMRASMPQMDASFFDSPALRYQTLESLVRQRVIAAAAVQRHLTVPDAQLARLLSEDPAIASLRGPDGKIDMDRLRAITGSQGMTPDGFVEAMRGQLATQQVLGAVTNTAFSTSEDARAALEAYFGQREIQRVAFATADFAAKVNPGDADIEQYYQAHLDSFRAPEQASIEYLVLDIDALRKNVKISEADLRSYYEQNQAQASAAAERRASHILITAPASASAADREKAKAHAEQLLAELKAKPDSFADVARKESQDPGSAAQGGDLDFVTRGAMVKPFEDALFALKNKGDLSGVVESEFGYHIIKLTDIKAVQPKSFEQMRAQLEEQVRTEEAQREYAKAAETFTNMVYEQSDSLKPTADALGLEIRTAQNIHPTPIPGVQGVLGSAGFLQAVFDADSVQNKRNTQAIEIGSNQLAAGRVVSHTPARTLPLADVRDTVRQRVINTQAAELARKEGAARLQAWQGGEAASGLSTPVTVSRTATQNLQPKEVDAALRADAGKLPAWVGVDLGDGGYSVIKVNAVQPRAAVSAEQATAEVSQFTQVWASAESQAYYDWLKKQLKVEIKVAKPTLGGLNG